MIQFQVGILVHTQEQMDTLFDLFTKTFPYIKAVKSKHECYILFPMVEVTFLFSGRSRGYRFDVIYYVDDASKEELNEIIIPQIAAGVSIRAKTHIRPISNLYQYFTEKENDNGKV